jgi:hypothetical protein
LNNRRLEDDALLSKYTPKLLADLADKKKCELISLENRNRKKLLRRSMALDKLMIKIFIIM